MRIVRTALSLLFVLSLTFSVTFAQQVTGNIMGRLTDASGSIIPGVSVKLTSPAIQGEKTFVTDEAGNYQFILLPPGTYTTTYELPGFKTVVREGVIVEVDKTTTINTSLAVASVAETITVNEESPVVDVTAASVNVNYDANVLKDLPTIRDYWQTIATAPGIQMTAVDVGGSHMGQYTSWYSYGLSGQTWLTIDGVPNTCFYNDYGAVAEMQVSSAANTAEMQLPGTSLNMILKTGGNQIHGEWYTDYEPKTFQSTNTNPALLAKLENGVGDGFSHYYDINGNVGGPFLKDKLWWFVSYRYNYSGIVTQVLQNNGTPGGIYYTTISNTTTKLNWKVNPKNELSTTLQYNPKNQPVRNGMGTSAHLYDIESTQYEYGPFWIAQGKWVSTLSPQATFELAANNYGYTQPQVPNPSAFNPATGQWNTRTQDLFTGAIRGADPTDTVFYRKLWQIKPTLSYYTPKLLGGSHNFKVGYGWMAHWEDMALRVSPDGPQAPAGDVVLIYNNGAPNEFTTTNTPFTNSNWLEQHYLFAQDKWQVNRKLTLNIGARYDFQKAYYPLQSNPGTGPFATSYSYPGRNVFLFRDLVPRLALAYDIFGNGRTAFKLSYGRYSETQNYSESTAANPNGSAFTSTYKWNGTLPITPAYVSTLTPISVAGQPHPVTVGSGYDPYVDEFTAGVDHQLLPNLGIHAGWVRKVETGELGTVNLAQPTSDFVPVVKSDPGVDGVAGGPTAVPFTVYNRVGAALTNNYLASFHNANNYSAFEVSATKRFSQRWQILGGWDWTKQNLEPTLSLDPNMLLYGSGSNRHLTQWTFKLEGTYDFPRGIRYTATFNDGKGLPYGREANFALNQGTDTLYVQPVGTWYLPSTALTNMKIQKTFAINDRNRVTAAIDCFNVFNINTAQGVDPLSTTFVNSAGQTVPRFGAITTIVPPRIFRIGARYNF